MSYSNGPRIVTDGLVLCLDAGNSKSYPGSGDIWYDISGNENNGTLINGPTYSAVHPASIYFDGVDNTVTTSISSPTIYTVSIVFKRNGTQTSNGAVLIGKRTSGCFDSAIYILSTTLLRAYKSGPEISIVSPLVDETWYNITILRKIDGTDFYINGIYQTGFSSIFNCNTMLENIGSSCNGEAAFKGSIALVQAYSTELLPSEILQNYNALKGRFGL